VTVYKYFNMIRMLVLAIVVFVTTIAAGTFGLTVVRAFWYSPDTEIHVPVEVESASDPAHYPERIRIPRLGIDAAVQHVGVNAHGNMAVPSNYTDTGWYKYGPAPGEGGSAVIAGHVNNGLGLSGVFEHLGELEAGDDMYVTRADGREVHFVVAGKRTYPYDDAPAEVIFNPSGSVRLNLITCEGSWVKEDKTYDQRLVVFTKLAEE
jgi:sortase A